MTLVLIKKSWLYIAIVFLCTLVGAYFYFQTSLGAITTVKPIGDEFELHMVTTEFKTTTEDGREIESYRWDPGTVYIPKGKDITLRIYGVNGKEHPFQIEGTNVSGTIRKGEETVLQLHFEEEGIYRLICTAHSTIDHHGPMIAYLIVD
ncbi:cupredoxin domain-containing protein [Halalkalibacter sp. APA_J-10(15)]|uniref:cupredoxin domain-containing protein n=1 Tax=Halalkalibacter sp. APA_J-10(15) TaxID=2933805 RepID=UPI001FF523F2|nr:cupredoxin domain-containing protein [Halalkalibacter sp. APA_J-10(15)]MCK0473120.1 cupredoxin domain-containing protein [Halalkalibacter sp. APA_J-10(15)]